MARVLARVFGPRKLADIRYDPYHQYLSRDIIQGSHTAKLNSFRSPQTPSWDSQTVRCPSCQSVPLTQNSRAPGAIPVVVVLRDVERLEATFDRLTEGPGWLR